MTTGTRDERWEATVAQLDEILRELWDKHPGEPIPPDAPLRTQGVDSSVLITFLVTVEERFSLSWGEDIPAGALGSLGSMAEIVVGDSPAVAERQA